MEEERSKQSVGKEEDAPRPWHALSVEETERLLGTSEAGLSDAEAAARLAKYGKNDLRQKKPKTARSFPTWRWLPLRSAP